MKRGFLLCLLILLTMAVIPATAQDSAAQSCDADSLKTAFDDLIATYQTAQQNAPDSASILQAAQALQDGIASLTVACSEATPEVTPQPESRDTELPTAGQWMLNWAEPGTKTCPNNPDASVLAYNRPILLRIEGDKIILEDIYVWPILEFELDEQNQYSYRRNVTLQDSSTLTFEYVFTQMSADHIEGYSSTIYERIDCHITNDFQIEFTQPGITCLVGSPKGANLRSGPGTKFDRAGKLGAGDMVGIDGQAKGDDNIVWWKLSDGGWVRSDVVDESTLCDSVPQAAP